MQRSDYSTWVSDCSMLLSYCIAGLQSNAVWASEDDVLAQFACDRRASMCRRTCCSQCPAPPQSQKTGGPEGGRDRGRPHSASGACLTACSRSLRSACAWSALSGTACRSCVLCQTALLPKLSSSRQLACCPQAWQMHSGGLAVSLIRAWLPSQAEPTAYFRDLLQQVVDLPVSLHQADSCVLRIDLEAQI